MRLLSDKRRYRRFGHEFEDLDSIAIPLYEVMSARLAELEDQRTDQYAGLFARTEAEEVIGLAQQEERWESEQHLRRKQAVDMMGLHLLKLAAEQRLKGILDALPNLTSPRRPKQRDDTCLDAHKWTYQHGLSIDFEQCPKYQTIKDLADARNASTHSDLTRYAGTTTSSRFIRTIEGRDEFSVSLESYRATAADVKDFIRWIVSELDKRDE